MEKNNDFEKLLSLPYDDFVKELKDLCNHHAVRALIKNGKHDGEIDDEKIRAFERSLAVKDLKPTQCEIGISDYFKSNKRRIANIIKGNTSYLNKNRILVAYLDDKYYIIDGHHRWCKIFLFNPDAHVPAIILNFEKLGYKDPEDILKIIQLALASTYKKIITEKEKDPFNALEKIKKKELREIISSPFINFLENEWDLDEEGIMEKLSNHLEMIRETKTKERIQRIFMPQTTETGKNDKMVDGQPKKFLKRLRNGEVDFKEPYIKSFENFKYNI